MASIAAVLLLALSSAVVRADAIIARNASLEASEDGWLLSTDFQITLSGPVEEALSKGITLSFILELEVSRAPIPSAA